MDTDRAVSLLLVRQCSLRVVHLMSRLTGASVVKTDWRNRLNERNLTDLMRIKVTGPTLHVFRERFGELAVDLWNSEKSRRKTQGKRKQYAARGKASNRTRETERQTLKDVGAECKEESKSEENEEEMEADVSELDVSG